MQQRQTAFWRACQVGAAVVALGFGMPWAAWAGPLSQITVVVDEAPTTTVVDVDCPAGYTTFVTGGRDRVCYEQDEVAANSNLQTSCPKHPGLYICPDDDD